MYHVSGSAQIQRNVALLSPFMWLRKDYSLPNWGYMCARVGSFLTTRVAVYLLTIYSGLANLLQSAGGCGESVCVSVLLLGASIRTASGCMGMGMGMGVWATRLHTHAGMHPPL